MSIWKDIFSGLADGFVQAGGVEHLQHRLIGDAPHHGLTRIESLCKVLGWGVDERNGKEIILYFNDPILRKRNLSIITGDTGKIAVLNVGSAVALPARQMPAEVMAYCLTRNVALTTGAWQMGEIGNGNMGFCVYYCALVDGMEAGVFKYIAETLISEVAEFDKKMRAAGVL